MSANLPIQVVSYFYLIPWNINGRAIAFSDAFSTGNNFVSSSTASLHLDHVKEYPGNSSQIKVKSVHLLFKHCSMTQVNQVL